jgi:hypothetical protein
MDMSGFTSYAERIDAQKIRERSASFFDHFSQAAMFFNSQSDVEQNHIVKALRVRELSYCALRDCGRRKILASSSEMETSRRWRRSSWKRCVCIVTGAESQPRRKLASSR